MKEQTKDKQFGINRPAREELIGLIGDEAMEKIDKYIKEQKIYSWDIAYRMADEE